MLCLSDRTRVTYTGSLPAGEEEAVLFSSTVSFGPRAATHYRCFWLDLALETDEAAGTQTVRLEKSSDGGTTWTTVGTPTAVGNGHTAAKFFVSPYQDFRLVYLNGTTPQTTFGVDLVIDHTSRSNPS